MISRPAPETVLGAVGENEEEVDKELGDEEGLVNLLEKDDAHLGSAIKIVIDRGLQGSYRDALSRHVRNKNSEIKSICNKNYEVRR